MRERLEAVSGNIPMVSLDVLTNQLKRNVDGQKTCIRCNRYVMMRYRQECNRCEATENLMYVYPVAGLRSNEGLLLCSTCRERPNEKRNIPDRKSSKQKEIHRIK